MIKVLLTRRVKAENYQRVLGLLSDLRAAAKRQPGYMGGETLARGRDPIEVLAVGTWLGEDCWTAWSTCQERIEIEDFVEPLIEGEASAAVYHLPEEAWEEPM
jgi:antibiotic biosynthesis monooxygenase (ABM) superfamily enzyme